MSRTAQPPALGTRIVDTLSGALAARTSRRGFLVKTAVVGSAVAADPLTYVLRPGSAYAVTCRCANTACTCSDLCCDGYTEFCCAITGSNMCPPGTFTGGWWKADGSIWCDGPRYYMDCHTQCSCGTGCIPGRQSFCTDDCDPAVCSCGNGRCDHRKVGCVTFRYGQCHTEITCAGRILCRVVSCTPAWVLDPTCSTAVRVDDNTANHNRPCLQDPPSVLDHYSAAALADGALIVGRDGGVFTIGGASFHGSLGGITLNEPIVAVVPTRTERGYWLVARDGGVFAFGDASFWGSLGAIELNQPIVGAAATPTGEGYWLVAADGGVFTFGDARFHGSLGDVSLNEPIVAMAPTRTGLGYWLVARDGGVFTFGDARFHGSLGAADTPADVGGLLPAPDGSGYAIWSTDGSLSAFGSAPRSGGYPALDASAQVPLPNAAGAFSAARLRGGRYVLVAIDALGPPPSARIFQLEG